MVKTMGKMTSKQLEELKADLAEESARGIPEDLGLAEDIYSNIRKAMRNEKDPCGNEGYICDVEPILNSLELEGVYSARDMREFLKYAGDKPPEGIFTVNKFPSWGAFNDDLQKLSSKGLRRAVYIIRNDKNFWSEFLPENEKAAHYEKLKEEYTELDNIRNALKSVKGFEVDLRHSFAVTYVIIEW